MKVQSNSVEYLLLSKPCHVYRVSPQPMVQLPSLVPSRDSGREVASTGGGCRSGGQSFQKYGPEKKMKSLLWS